MRKYVPLFMLGVAFLIIIGVSCYTYPSNQAQQNDAQKSGPTAAAPANVNHPPDNAETSKDTPNWPVLFEWPHGVETLALIATLFVIAWQATLMVEHAQHFEKLASETQKQTANLEDTAKRQLRAYLTVSIGQATYQERRTKEKGGDLRSQSDPVLVNTGETPARKIRFKARAAIFPWPLPKETRLPEGCDDGIGESIVGGKQSVNMFAVVDGYCQDEEVQAIKEGVGAKGLYVWGACHL